jgi:hypothetical protein
MLTTDKNEIIESICMDLEGASDSALARLAETFDCIRKPSHQEHQERVRAPRGKEGVVVGNPGLLASQ